MIRGVPQVVYPPLPPFRHRVAKGERAKEQFHTETTKMMAMEGSTARRRFSELLAAVCY
jgi:hypothetical protein